MATISTEGGVFTLGYQALSPDGQPGHFQSCFTPSGQVVFERRQDMRPREEILIEGIYRRRKQPPSETRAGIYRTRVFPDLLVFIDKLEDEDSIFLNWRRAPSCEYTRVAIGVPFFYPSGPVLSPGVSDILFHKGVLALAWIRPTGLAHELVFSKVQIDASAERRDEVLVSKLPYVTMVAAANIGPEAIVSAHRGIREDSDARLIVHFTRIDVAG